MNENKRIYALGFFDGVHLGHQALLKACRDLARSLDCATAAITFDRHPQSLFTAAPPAMINSAQDRQRLLMEYGIAHVCELQVNDEVMSTSWRDFLDHLLAQGAVGFVCGDDFRFGARGEGDGKKLEGYCRERGLPCIIVPEQTLDGVRISSTHIRGLLEQGDMETAAKFLGHPHILTGIVVSGRHIGRTIGVPTANIRFPEGVAVPKLGVYACRCMIGGQWYLAVTNVGFRPTVEGHQTRAESWILDFDGDLYGQELTLEFYKFLRPERKFDSLEDLRTEIHQNARQTRALFE